MHTCKTCNSKTVHLFANRMLASSILLLAGCSVFTSDPYAGLSEEDKLIRLVEDNEVAEVRARLEAEPDLVTRRFKGGMTLLYCASFQPTPEVCRLLLEAGADPLAREPGAGLTPLHRSAINGEIENVKVMAEFVSDLDPLDELGFTPLFYAVRSRSPGAIEEVAPYLIAKGAKVDLNIAACMGDLERVNAFLDGGPEALFGCKYPEEVLTDLVIAIGLIAVQEWAELGGTVELSIVQDNVASRFEPTLKRLFAMGYKADTYKFHGAPPTFVAVSMESTATAEILLEAGADPNFPIPVFGSLLRVATPLRPKMQALLRRYGATGDGGTAPFVPPGIADSSL